MTEIISSDLLV